MDVTRDDPNRFLFQEHRARDWFLKLTSDMDCSSSTSSNGEPKNPFEFHETISQRNVASCV